jgi:hypothetical protein
MFGGNSRDYRLASHAGEVAQGLGWKMLIGKNRHRRCPFEKGEMGIFVA